MVEANFNIKAKIKCEICGISEEVTANNYVEHLRSTLFNITNFITQGKPKGNWIISESSKHPFVLTFCSELCEKDYRRIKK